MSLQTRLALTMVVMGLLLLGPTIYGLQRLSRLSDIALELQGQHATASLALGRLRSALADLDLRERSYLAAPDPAARQAVRDALAGVIAAAATLRAAGYGDVMGELTHRSQVLALAVWQIEELVEAGDVQAATDAFRTLRSGVLRQDSTLASLAREIDRRSTGAAENARHISITAGWVVLVGVVGSLTLAIALGAGTTKAVTVPIRRLREAMTRVAAGRFEAPGSLPYERRDEVGDLSRAFRSMSEQLAELDRMRAEFMSIASHELKTPVHVIGAYAQLIEHQLSADLTEDRAEMFRAMQNQVKDLARMVNELLDLSRLEANAAALDAVEVELEQILHSVRQSFAAISRQQQIDFRIERDPGAPATIMVDEDRITHALLGNLLGNAFKFTEPGGLITLRVRGEADRVWFEVSDNGRGIPPEHVPRVFEKYYQLTSRDRKMGAGLGLSVARAVARAHGGDISVESRLGEGSTFRVDLPLRPKGSPPESARPPAPTPNPAPARVEA